MHHRLQNTVFVIEMSVPVLHMKNGYACYTASLNLIRKEMLLTWKQLNEKYSSIVTAMWYKTNNKSTVSWYLQTPQTFK